MSYQRKREDKKRLKKLTMDYVGGWPAGAYEATDRSGHKTYLRRYWKSQGKKSSWAWNKKYSHKVYRRFTNKYDFYTKKAFDLWNVW